MSRLGPDSDEDYYAGADDGLRYGDFDGLDYEDTDRGYARDDPNVNDDTVGGEVGGESSPAYHTGDDDDVPAVKVRDSDIDIGSILCPDHSLNLDPGCSRCDEVKNTLHPKIFESLRVVDASKSSIPDASARFSSMRPKKKPSLVLSPTSMSFAKMVYQSVPLTESQYKELIRENVHLGPELNSELMANITRENP